MPIAFRFVAALMVMIATMIASIGGLERAQNPAAARGVAIMGLLIIAFCGAFGLLGIYLGAKRRN